MHAGKQAAEAPPAADDGARADAVALSFPTQPLPPASVAPEPAIGSVRGVLAAAALGFLVGAVFWHFVGFWGFVRDIVLKGPDREASIVAQTGPWCTAVALDRVAGGVRMDTCPADAPWLAEHTSAGKGDLVTAHRPVAGKRWSVTVQADGIEE